MASYIRVTWLHSFADEPRLLYSELNDERWETRKVEQFPDGRFGFASAKCRSAKTKLGEEIIPLLSEIAADPQFEPVEITKEEFETVWEMATWQT